MLAIRLQRLGRKGYPVYRIAIQEAQRHPSSGRVIAYVGSYNPHTKDVSLQKEDIEKYLGTGAQPTPRVVKLLKQEGVKLPSWVKDVDASKQKTIKNQDKLRKNQPKENPVEEPVASDDTTDDTTEAPAAETAEETPEAPAAEEK